MLMRSPPFEPQTWSAGPPWLAFHHQWTKETRVLALLRPQIPVGVVIVAKRRSMAMRRRRTWSAIKYTDHGRYVAVAVAVGGVIDGGVVACSCLLVGGWCSWGESFIQLTLALGSCLRRIPARIRPLQVRDKVYLYAWSLMKNRQEKAERDAEDQERQRRR